MMLRSNKFPLLLLCSATVILSGCQSLQQNKVSVKYYNISGDSTSALDKQIKLKGPKVAGGRHAVAVARIKMIPNLKYSASPKKCRITRANVAVDAKVTLPHWTGRPHANKQLIKAWDNIDKYTRLHESVHVAIAFRFAKQMELELLKMYSPKGCDDLRVQARGLIDKFLIEHDKVQKKFDADEQKRFSTYAKQNSKKSG